MPRKASMLSIQELRRCLAAQEREVVRLKKKREKLTKELAKVDKAIAAAGGSLSPAPAGKARATKLAGAPGRKSRKSSSAKPLINYILGVLKGSPKGIRVRDVMNAVTRAGYVSRSKDFYGIVATALREGPQFKNISHGIYALK